MKAAFSAWDHRIAPLFDVSRMVCIIETEAGDVVHKRFAAFESDLPAKKILCLVRWETDTLVCGAISRSMHSILTAQGIRVIPFIAGDLSAVIGARLTGCIGNGAAQWALFYVQ